MSNESQEVISNAEKRRLKILIAEDDEISYLLMTELLNEISEEILHVKTGLDAIELCKKNSDLDLILMDIKMPLMDGHEATRQIRKFNCDIKIIAQTAYGLTEDRQKAIDAGCNDYVTKPLSRERLFSVIDAHI